VNSCSSGATPIYGFAVIRQLMDDAKHWRLLTSNPLNVFCEEDWEKPLVCKQSRVTTKSVMFNVGFCVLRDEGVSLSSASSIFLRSKW
jgi:hypothetical protein